jgi:hypothetical protein
MPCHAMSHPSHDEPLCHDMSCHIHRMVSFYAMPHPSYDEPLCHATSITRTPWPEKGVVDFSKVLFDHHIITQCVFVHVGPINIPLGCHNYHGYILGNHMNKYTMLKNVTMVVKFSSFFSFYRTLFSFSLDYVRHRIVPCMCRCMA